jgi:hypothetical protein
MITRSSDWLKNDSRFKSWGKKVRPQDVDLSKENGYALGGAWARWDESVALGAGEFLVVAAETGSRASHDYDYALIEGGETARCLFNGQDKAKGLPAEEWRALKEAALKDLPEDQRAKAMNSTLYRFAAVIHHLGQSERVAKALGDIQEEVRGSAWCGIFRGKDGNGTPRTILGTHAVAETRDEAYEKGNADPDFLGVVKVEVVWGGKMPE